MFNFLDNIQNYVIDSDGILMGELEIINTEFSLNQISQPIRDVKRKSSYTVNY